MDILILQRLNTYFYNRRCPAIQGHCQIVENQLLYAKEIALEIGTIILNQECAWLTFDHN